jgi:hypothetical protein
MNMPVRRCPVEAALVTPRPTQTPTRSHFV